MSGNADFARPDTEGLTGRPLAERKSYQGEGDEGGRES